MATGSDLDLDAVAREMKAAQDAARSLQAWTSRLPGFDLDGAYEVSRRVHALRVASGARPVGRKIGFTNPDMWARYGVREPIWSHVYAHTVAHVPSGDASCTLAAFVEPKIEPEIVLHFASAPGPGADAAAILRALDWVAHGFEVVQSHFPGWRFEAADTVADSSLHGCLFVGAPHALAELHPDPAHALESFRLELSRDGALVETGCGRNVLGSPLIAIEHLVRVLAQRGDAPIAAGEIVTTGTITTAQSVSPGEVWTTRLDGVPLPGLTLRFTA